MRFILFLILLLASLGQSFAQHSLDVAIFTGKKSNHYVFRVLEGRYHLAISNDEFYRLPEGSSIHIYTNDDRFIVKSNEQSLGTFHRLYFRGLDDYNTFFIGDAEERFPARQYDDDLSFSFFDQQARLINHVATEKYTAGVVESETGHFSDPDFLKTQAIIARTYALRNQNKHFEEGYNLCDRVHCQAYKSRAYYTNALAISLAVAHTKGLVLYDKRKKMIDATFFSNCGGQTAHSEKVWSATVPYLRSVEDPHCAEGDHFHWEKELSKKEVEKYLGIKLPKHVKTHKNMKYFPKSKKKLTAFRRKFSLPSCQFELRLVNGKCVLEGQGFGHGVGLCQEGAAAMGSKGFSFMEILRHYYQHIIIAPVKVQP